MPDLSVKQKADLEKDEGEVVDEDEPFNPGEEPELDNREDGDVGGLEGIDSDTMSIDDFKKLGVKAVAKNRKVDWDEVLKDILVERKPFSTTHLRKLAQKHAFEKDKRVDLYYSELTRVIAKWEQDKTLDVVKKVRESDKRVFYYVYRRG